MLRKYFSVLLFTMLPLLMARGVETRYITPPCLDAAHLGKRIVCHRPMRHEGPNMKIEVRYGSVIAHNYGHGGSGWTLGPGCASYVVDLFKAYPGVNLTAPVTVLGAGALGLFSACELHKQGFRDITIVSDKFDDLTSHNAGGLLAPVSMDNNPEMQETIDVIGVEAYKFYHAIATGVHPDFKSGAVIVPTYFENREDSGLEPYIKQGVMQPSKDVVLDFGNGTTRAMVAYDDGIFIDTAVMMEALTAHLKAKGVRFVQQKIGSFWDLNSNFIINCSGLSSKDLNNDGKIQSVQGHLIMLKDQNPTDLQHMILVYFNEAISESRQIVKRSFYMFPKHLSNTGPNDVGVIGGTFIEGATSETPNTSEFGLMIEGAKKFYGIK